MRRLVSLVTLVGLAVAVSLALGATSAPARTTPFSFTFDVTVTEIVCGIPVEIHDVGKGNGRESPSGVSVTNDGTRTYTNLTNGLSATSKFRVLFKNSPGVENVDGTITFDQTVVGASTLRGPDGAVLLRTHGPITIHLTIDPNATSEADFVVASEVLFERGSHPSDAAFCSALTAAIGPGA